MNINHQSPRYHRSFATIDLSAIRQNFLRLKSCMQPGVKALAVVKADAYGHGSVMVSKALESEADYFAVACIDEGIELRKNGIKKPILILSYTAPALYGELIEHELTATIYCREEAEQLSKEAIQRGTKVKVHIPVDTGMGRIGVLPDDSGADVVLYISRLPGIELEGIFSHYACADCKDLADAESQTRLFDDFISLLEQRNLSVPIKHICNSAGAMYFSKQYDMCRLGIALYGLYPSEEVEKSRVLLQPAMEVVSHVIQVKIVPKGYKIGYGHIYEAPAKRRIATVSIGYADGFNRCLTGVGYVLINGKKAPVVGKVCMDQIMVDVTEHGEVSVGDHAVIMGQSGEERITAEELGAMTHSFNYEVICNFMPRVKRVYYQDGSII